jgi:hypothetical protein
MRVRLLFIFLARNGYDGNYVEYLLQLIPLLLGYFKFRNVRVALIIDLVLAHARPNYHLLVINAGILSYDRHLVN